MTRLFLTCFSLLMFCASESMAQNAKDRAKLRTILEPMFKTDLEKLEKDILNNTTADWPKVFSYNKAYIYYSCAIQMAADSKKHTPDVNECAKERRLAMAENFRIVANNGPSLRKNTKAYNCFLKHRMLKAEKEFPPYDYQKGKGVQLFDYKPLNECLRSALL